MKTSAEALGAAQTVFLSKQALTIIAGQTKRCSDVHFLGDLVLRTASAFLGLGKRASITAVDLIQRKKLDSWNFYESNLTEARFEII